MDGTRKYVWPPGLRKEARFFFGVTRFPVAVAPARTSGLGLDRRPGFLVDHVDELAQAAQLVAIEAKLEAGQLGHVRVA